MTAAKVLRYQLRDLRRSRWILGYALLLLALTDALLRFGGGGPRAVLSLLNVVLVFVPLVSIVFGTMYLYGARGPPPPNRRSASVSASSRSAYPRIQRLRRRSRSW